MFYYAPPGLPPNSPLVVAVSRVSDHTQTGSLISYPDPLLFGQRSHVFKLGKLHASRKPIQVCRHISTSDPR
jgi:hypothetical protein